MYNVQLNENNFFTGIYASVGTVKDGVDVDKLPPSENSLCYKLVDKTITEAKQVPVLEHTKITESETELITIYSMKIVDEECMEFFVDITEEEYDALSDEEKENVTIAQFPEMIVITLSDEEYKALSIEEQCDFVTGYKVNENGEVVFETAYVTKAVKDWEFSQERYDELEAAKAVADEQAKANAEYQESISNETLKAENRMLTEQVDMLTTCLLEMSELVYA